MQSGFCEACAPAKSLRRWARAKIVALFFFVILAFVLLTGPFLLSPLILAKIESRARKAKDAAVSKSHAALGQASRKVKALRSGAKKQRKSGAHHGESLETAGTPRAEGSETGDAPSDDERERREEKVVGAAEEEEKRQLTPAEVAKKRNKETAIRLVKFAIVPLRLLIVRRHLPHCCTQPAC